MSSSTLPDPVATIANTAPSAPALVSDAETWSWADLDERVAACAARLVAFDEAPHPALGVPLVGTVAWTQPDAVVLLFAALRAGVALAPLSPRWPAAALDEATARLGVAVVIADAEAPTLSSVRTERLDEIAASGRDGLYTAAFPADRPWTVVHTSGSSGAPKAAVLTFENHVASAQGVAERLGLGSDDTWLLNLPMWHVGGISIAVRCAMAGAVVAVPERGLPTAEALARFEPTHTSLVSTQLARVLRAAHTAPVLSPGEVPDEIPGEALRDALHHLRGVLLGGSAIAPGLLADAVRVGLPVSVGYALSEMTSTVTMTDLDAGTEALATSGTVLSGRDVRVSASGEIEVRGSTLFAGYLRGGEIERPLAPDGWFATGDLGRLDADGRLVVTGRQGNRFISGGENVQPEAIEAALARLDGVSEAVVVPVEDAEFGFRPVAFVRPDGDVSPDTETLQVALRETLPGFAIPVAFHVWEGPDGMKPDRSALARLAERLKRDEG